jgi:hypothetical protein
MLKAPAEDETAVQKHLVASSMLFKGFIGPAYAGAYAAVFGGSKL